MAADFLKTYGVDLDEILCADPASSNPNSAPFAPNLPLAAPTSIVLLRSVLLARSPTTLFDIHLDLSTSTIKSITPSKSQTSSPALESSAIPSALPFTQPLHSTLLLPSLCHPHIHLDKPHLLSHPLTSHLIPTSGTFPEALRLTSDAKALYTSSSLLERGNWLIADSMRAGVTAMRAFVEADETVGLMCVKAGLELKRMWAGRCEIQICVFAQDPVFTGEHAGGNRGLVREALGLEGVEGVGSTPYVEGDDEFGRQNIEWAVKLAVEFKVHLDFHLDYNLDSGKAALVWDVLETLKREGWHERNVGKTVCLGHCTRLTLFGREEWRRLAAEIRKHRLPVYFVGLPTSDVFMQGRPDEGEEVGDRPRATLQVPWMIDRLGLKAALGVNNVGNAFTPQGSADPLSVASMGVGLYQVGTAEKAECLYECVSTRAREAIGLGTVGSLELAEGMPTDLIAFGHPRNSEPPLSRRRRTVKEVVYDPPRERMVIHKGKDVSSSLASEQPRGPQAAAHPSP